MLTPLKGWGGLRYLPVSPSSDAGTLQMPCVMSAGRAGAWQPSPAAHSHPPCNARQGEEAAVDLGQGRGRRGRVGRA